MNLVIARQAIEDAVAHAVAMSPIQSCGYMTTDTVRITRYIPMTNIDNSLDHFTFDPKEQFQVMKSSRALGERLAVVVHSHPVTPARLSAEDIRLFNDPSMAYLIISLRDYSPKWNVFTLRKNGPGDIDIKKIEVVIDG